MSALLDRYRRLAHADPDVIEHAIATLPYNDLLELPAEIVRTWPGTGDDPATLRGKRVHRLTTEKTTATWRVKDYATAAGVTDVTASKWRGNYIARDPDWRRCMPPPDVEIGQVKQPGDIDNPGGTPLWYPCTGLRWLIAVDAVDLDGYPHEDRRPGRKSTGRRPKPRNPAPTTVT